MQSDAKVGFLLVLLHGYLTFYTGVCLSAAKATGLIKTMLHSALHYVNYYLTGHVGRVVPVHDYRTRLYITVSVF